MATTKEGDNIMVHQDLDDDTLNNAAGNIVVPGRSSTGDAAGSAAGGAAGTTNFNLRIEQKKIPEFFGSKSKDTISAMDFIWRLEDLAKTNWWTGIWNAHWLSSMVNMDNEEPDQLLWLEFKDIFKQEYAVQTKERLILEGLCNLTMKPNETTNEVISRFTRTVQVIKESFEDYRGVIPYPHNDCN